MHGLEGAVLVPLLILGSAAILYFGLISTRRDQLERRRERREQGRAERGAVS